MPDLHFRVESAAAIPFAAGPNLALQLRIENAPAHQQIHAVVLRCQIRIDPTRRRYTTGEQELLLDLYGEPARWGQTLRSMLWTHCHVMVPSFQGTVSADLTLPCTFDFNVAVTKYFHALEDGLVPLVLLFSGTVFHETEDGQLQAEQIPWEKEAFFQLPVGIWKDVMNHYYPNSAWLCLRRDVFDQFHRHKIARGLPTWEMALLDLLKQGGGQP